MLFTYLKMNVVDPKQLIILNFEEMKMKEKYFTGTKIKFTYFIVGSQNSILDFRKMKNRK